MKPAPPLSYAAADSLIRKYLTPLRGWHDDKKQRLAEVLQSCSVSFAHAEATLQPFEAQVPTPAEIRDSAANQKRLLYPEPDPIELWKEELIREQGDATPRPFVPDPVPSVQPDALPPQGSPPMFRLVAKRLGIRMNERDWGRTPWSQIYEAMRELGYRLNSDQERMLTGTPLPPSEPANVITEADIEAAIKQMRAERGES